MREAGGFRFVRIDLLFTKVEAVGSRFFSAHKTALAAYRREPRLPSIPLIVKIEDDDD